MKITSFNLNLTKIAAGILLGISWYNGTIIDNLPWILLLMLIDFTLSFKK